jgi:iron(III) transport system substrate-binding protein
VNPQAEVWFGGPTTIFQRGAADSLLADYRPSWASSVPKTGGDQYFPVYRTPAIIAYNSAAVSASEAPKDWDDVLAPRWHDRVLIRDPVASGTMRAIWGLIIERSIWETGDTSRAMAWFAPAGRADPNLRAESGTARREARAAGGMVTLWDLPDILISRSKGMPFGYTFPSSGTVVIDDAVALVRGAKHPEAAKEYIEFVGSIEGQLLTARKVYRLPARLDLPADSVPQWVADVEQEMKVAPMDWEMLASKAATG